MKSHAFLDDDLRDRAALYVLGNLPEEAAREFGTHLPECETCRREVEDLGGLARRILAAAPTRTPPARAWDGVLAKVRGEAREAGPVTPVGALFREAASALPGEFTFVGSDESAWQPTGVEGIEARRLFVDVESQRVTILARMAPGTAYPSHRHADVEECFVLQGDLSVGDRRMRAGDYQRAETGSVHGVQSTREGCVLLLVSSLRDELVA